MRLPRIFGKKRGHRRTGSQAWGSFGDGLFHGALVCAGVVFGGLLISGVAVPEWRINHDFIAARGRVLAKGLVKRTIDDPLAAATATWRPTLRVRYDAAGTSREGWTRSQPSTGSPDRDAATARLATWDLGSEVPLWYDPADPAAVVLERGYNWWLWLLTLLLPGALLAFGGSGLLRAVARWGRSDESLAAARAARGLLDPVLGGAREAAGHPGVPDCEDLVNSPGTLLRYRLPIESPTGWRIAGLGLFAMIWNAVLAVLIVSAGFGSGKPGTDWLLALSLAPFAAVGLGGIVAFVRAFLRQSGGGTSQLEISDHPLFPGGRYELLLAHAGTGTLRGLDVSLEMEEEAGFRQGTDTRTDRLVVIRRPVESWCQVTLAPGTRFEGRATITIPPDAMHSFVSEHNAIRWRIAVRGRPDRRPAFTRLFPVVVFPGDAPSAPEPPAR